MATEIERKYLVVGDAWQTQVSGHCEMKQGYLAGSEKASIRIRVEGGHANINIKSATLDITRKEYEIPMDIKDAEEILSEMCDQPLIEKTRYYIPLGEHEWEVDVFHGDNAGLVVAEIELQDKNESFEKPTWLGREVSDDKRYYNVCLVKHPYKNW